MAQSKSLQEKLKMSGQLGSVSNEEMQNLASKTGRTNVPSTPLEGSVLGGNKDQAKMMGSSASLKSTMTNLGETPDSLAATQRRAQARQNMTAEEQAAQNKASELNKLSSLDSRVQNIATGLVNKAGLAGAASGQVGLSEAGQGLDAEAQTAITALQTAVPGSPEALQAAALLNQKMGRGAGSLLTADEIKANLGSITQQLSQAAAQNTQNTVTVQDLDLPSMGFTDSNELASILGMDPTELAGLDVTKLGEKVQAQIQSEYSKVSSLEEQANDLNRSAAERASARKQLRDLGAVGVRSTETAVDKLADQIEDSKTVEFDGKELAIDEMLDDDMISGLAAKYLDDTASANPEWKKQFKENNPDLANWLDTNKDALGESIKNIDETTKELASIQEDNLNVLRGKSVAVPLTDTEIEALGFNTDISTERIDPASSPVLTVLNGTDKNKSEALRNSIKNLTDVDPALTAQLTGLNESQLRDIGALTPSDPKLQNFIQYQKDVKAIQSIPDGDYKGFFTQLFGKTVDDTQLASDLKEMVRRERSGMFGEASPLTKFLPSMVGPNGKLLPLPQIAANLKGKMTAKGIQDLLTNPASLTSLSDKLKGIGTYNSRLSPSQGLYDKLKSAYDNDGKLDINEYSAVKSKMTADDLAELHKNPKSPQKLLDQVAKDYYNRKFKDYDNEISSIGGMTAFEVSLQEPKGAVGKDEYDKLRATKDLTLNMLNDRINQAAPGSVEQKALQRHQKELTDEYSSLFKKIDNKNEIKRKEAERDKKIKQLKTSISMNNSQLNSGSSKYSRGLAPGDREKVKASNKALQAQIDALSKQTFE